MSKTCPRCNENFARKQCLTRHLEEKKIPCDFQCRHCRKKAKNLSDFEEHMRSEHPPPPAEPSSNVQVQALPEVSNSKPVEVIKFKNTAGKVSRPRDVNHHQIIANLQEQRRIRILMHGIHLDELKKDGEMAKAFAQSFDDEFLYNWLKLLVGETPTLSVGFLAHINGGTKARFIRANSKKRLLWIKTASGWSERLFMNKSVFIKELYMVVLPLLTKEAIRRLSFTRIDDCPVLFMLCGDKAKTVSKRGLYAEVLSTSSDNCKPCEDQLDERKSIEAAINSAVFQMMSTLFVFLVFINYHSNNSIPGTKAD